jgi:hypothetical protein
LPLESLLASGSKADDSARLFVKVAIVSQLGDAFAKDRGSHLLLGNVQVLCGIALVHLGEFTEQIGRNRSG